jgi:predicted NUDIX family NTP pyrophosphohydrolase
MNRIVLDYTKKIITSHGLIVYSMNTKKWLLVCRKHTSEFINLMRGCYRNSYIYLLLQKITEKEKKWLIKCCKNNIFYFSKIYIREVISNEKNIKSSYKRLQNNKDLILDFFENFVYQKQNFLLWYWPKGKIEKNENPFQCAVREFQEEVGVELPEPVYVYKEIIKENFYTIDGITIESRLWICFIEKEFEIPKFDFHIEISDRKWFSEEECFNILQGKIKFNKICELKNQILLNL